MKKLFISQPMNGLSNEEIEKERNRILEYVKTTEFTREDGSKFNFKNEDVELIDSFFKDAPHDAKPLWFLGKSFELLSTADIVVFGGKWKEFRGCKLEREAARQYMTNVLVIEM